MKKTILATTIALALSTTLAAAQSSQGQAGANTGPTSNSANSDSKLDHKTNKGSMSRDHMTTGSSSGRMTGGSAGAGNNGNSMSGSNSLANPNNAAGPGSGAAGMK